MAGTVLFWLCAFFLLIAPLVLVIYQVRHDCLHLPGGHVFGESLAIDDVISFSQILGKVHVVEIHLFDFMV
ncbi:hypothetical protein HPP92_020928 [Vanilla planifolia]|uniref:Uncharacterized protein n=1 Tax=Vanilla planifolia TaxID=51239 RepID=A0A835UIH6_VANPL|nr:hypothetical protein HPP92_020928 [Vanilla planifolia]